MGVGVPVPEPRTFPEPVEDTAAQAADAQSAGTDAAAQTENAADDSAQAPANTETEIRQLLNRQQNKIKLICIEKHYIL